MANYQYTGDIIDDVLFRMGESTGTDSDYYSAVLRYVNRAYRSLYMGNNEFEQRKSIVWWWMKAEGSIIMNPSIKTGTVSVTNNSASITFSSAPSSTVAGYFFKVNDHPDVFKVSAHTGGETGATLDTVYTGDTDTAASYRLVDLEYDLASDCIKTIAPMRAYRDSKYEIHGTSLTEMESRYPLNQMWSGIPKFFAHVDDNTIRFSHFGSDDGDLYRLDYDYIARPADLTDSGSEEPVIPREYRHILADMALYYAYIDKNDDNATNQFNIAASGIKAMKTENTHRWQQMGRPGAIYPRQGDLGRYDGPLRTESGLIIG